MHSFLDHLNEKSIEWWAKYLARETDNLAAKNFDIYGNSENNFDLISKLFTQDLLRKITSSSSKVVSPFRAETPLSKTNISDSQDLFTFNKAKKGSKKPYNSLNPTVFSGYFNKCLFQEGIAEGYHYEILNIMASDEVGLTTFELQVYQFVIQNTNFTIFELNNKIEADPLFFSQHYKFLLLRRVRSKRKISGGQVSEKYSISSTNKGKCDNDFNFSTINTHSKPKNDLEIDIQSSGLTNFSKNLKFVFTPTMGSGKNDNYLQVGNKFSNGKNMPSGKSSTKQYEQFPDTTGTCWKKTGGYSPNILDQYLKFSNGRIAKRMNDANK